MPKGYKQEILVPSHLQKIWWELILVQAEGCLKSCKWIDISMMYSTWKLKLMI